MTTSSTGSSSLNSLINQLNGTSSSSSSTSSTSSTSSSSSTDMQAQFLTLLTTQLQNQDPLNPMDNAQVTSQLAQISTVSGINQLNTTLTSLLNDSVTSQTLQAAALVGHGALVAGSHMDLGSSGAIGGYDLASAADTVTVQVLDSSGNVVRTMQMTNQSAGVQGFVWDGKSDSGTAEPEGSYTFKVSATQANNTVTATALQYGTISGVLRDSSTGSVDVSVGNYGNYTLDQLEQII